VIEGLFLDLGQISRINIMLGKIDSGLCDPPTVEGLTGAITTKRGITLSRDGVVCINKALTRLNNIGDPPTVESIFSR